jgi:hypothetical protein
VEAGHVGLFVMYHGKVPSGTPPNGCATTIHPQPTSDPPRAPLARCTAPRVLDEGMGGARGAGGSSPSRLVTSTVCTAVRTRVRVLQRGGGRVYVGWLDGDVEDGGLRRRGRAWSFRHLEVVYTWRRFDDDDESPLSLPKLLVWHGLGGGVGRVDGGTAEPRRVVLVW